MGGGGGGGGIGKLDKGRFRAYSKSTSIPRGVKAGGEQSILEKYLDPERGEAKERGGEGAGGEGAGCEGGR